MRATVIIAGFLVAAVVLAVERSELDPMTTSTPTTASGSEPDIAEERHRLDELVEGQRRFVATIERTERELLAGSLSLDEGASLVLESARTDNPQLLRWIEKNISAPTSRQKVMQLLLGRIRVVSERGLLTSVQQERAECLHRERESAAAER